MSFQRYLALAGDDAAIRRILASYVPPSDGSLRLNRQFDRDGLVLFASPETPLVRFDADCGIVVGRLFGSGPDRSRVRSLDRTQTRSVIDTRGQALIDSYWGNYVAFILDGRDAIVLRDPSAAVPVYQHAQGDIYLYCSDLALGSELSGSPVIDDEFVLQWLNFPFLRNARSGLRGWTEVLPGTAQSCAGSAETLWSPVRAIRGCASIGDLGQAAELVLTQALTTVSRLVDDLSAPVLELSGGLDSSIVAACLHRAGLPFKAVNFATRLPDGDERHYARKVAAHLGVGLTELVEDHGEINLGPGGKKSLRPALSPVLQPLDRARQAFAQSQGALTFITGAGGDNIFSYLGTAAPVLDAVRQLSLWSGLRTLGDVAELGDCTMFKAARYSLKKALLRPIRPYWKEDRRFLSRSAIAQRPEPHPWLAGAGGLSAGKLEHVESLVRAQHFLEPQYWWGGEVRHPLLNQLLMEACLQIPAWLWVAGGRDRAVARAAFKGLLPPEIVNRRTKGRLESMCARAFADNRPELAELILKGELASRQLIDRRALESYLRNPDPPRDDDYFRVFDLASLEIWLRSWRG